MGLLSWLSLDKKRGGDNALDRDKGEGPSKKHTGAAAASAPKTRSRAPSEERDRQPSKKNASSKKNSAASDKKRKQVKDSQKKSSSSASRKQQQQQEKNKASGSGIAGRATRGGATANGGRGRSSSPPRATANGINKRSGGRDGANNNRNMSPPRKQQQQEKKAEVYKKASKKRRRDASPSSPTTSTAEAAAAADAPKRQQQQQQLNIAGATTTTGGLKRVRSSWRLRPLIVDEKLRVFVEGRDEELLHYDGGEFWKWLKDCEVGAADPTDGFPYPLVVQDSDLRTVLEIKEPAAILPQTAAAAVAAATAKRAKKNASDGTAAITVPTWSVLPEKQRADAMLRAMDPSDVPVVNRNAGGDTSLPDVHGSSAAAAAVAAAWSSAQAALASDPPFLRYVQPTPDDLDLAIEYDLDEEDEEWLATYNESVKRHGGGNSKARSAKKPLAEEWLEHLIDRMEKEYTAELQRHPEKWVLGAGAGNNIGDGAAPEVSLPPIEEVFPLEKCLQLEGINQYESVVKAVYKYWVVKHRKAGRPLIPRLWYEPPWDKKAAARRLASADGAEEDGGDGVFAGHESPLALAGIRKRRMDAMEVRGRFENIRRDLEAARTLADQVRRREKLKRREAQLLKEEWAARMQDVADGQRVVLVKGKLKERPPQVHALKMLSRAGAHDSRSAAAQAAAAVLGFDPFDLGGEIMPAVAEDRAARLAARRDARDAAAGFLLFPTRPAAKTQPPPSTTSQRPLSRPVSALHRPASAAGGSRSGAGAGVRGPAPVRGVTRDPHCVWCGSETSDSLLLGCRTCHRCFCFKCFQRRPGLGVNNWSRAVKDALYQCVICRGLENEEDGDLELQELGYDGGTGGNASADASKRRAARAADRGGGSAFYEVEGGADGLPKVIQPRRATGQFAPFPKSSDPAISEEEEEDVAAPDDSDSETEDSSSDDSSSSDDDDVDSSDSDSSSSSDDDSESEGEEAFFDKEESEQAEVDSTDESSSSDDEEEDEEAPGVIITTSRRHGQRDRQQSIPKATATPAVKKRQLKKKDTKTTSSAKKNQNRKQKQSLSPRRLPRRYNGDAGYEGDEAAAALEEAEAAISNGKKVPRELLSLLRRKSKASSKQQTAAAAAAAKNKKDNRPSSRKGVLDGKNKKKGRGPGVIATAATKVKSGEGPSGGSSGKRKREAAKIPAPASAQKGKKKRRSGSGMSRADVEIMLQQAVTTPSRKLRSGKK